MEFMYLIPFVIVTVGGLIAFFVGRETAKKHGKRLAQIEAVPKARGTEVAKHAPDMAKMYGTVIAPGGTLESPIEGLECVYYRLIVEEEKTRTRRNAKGETTTERVWVPIVDAAKMVAAGIEDADGAIEVSLAEAELMLKDGAKQQTGMFTDVSPRLRKMIEEEYDEKTTGFLTKKTLRIREQVLEVGEKALVVGKVKLIRTSRGVRPRFVRGKQPLLVTDKTDAQLRDHFKWAVWWSNFSIYAGGGCGSVAAVGLVLLALYFGVNRLFYGKPASGVPGTGALFGPQDAASQVLAGMRSPDKWTRRRSVEPLGKGPEGELAAKKGEIKAGLMKLLAEQDEHVYIPAAGVLPAWAEKGDVPQLIAWLDDPRAHVRRAAAAALGKMQEETALEPLKAAFPKDPEGIAPSLKAYGPKVEAFAASLLFHERNDLHAHAEKLMEGQPNRAALWFDAAIGLLDDPKRRGKAGAWLEAAVLTDEQKAKAADAIAKVATQKKVAVPRSLAVAFAGMARKEHAAALGELLETAPDEAAKALKAFGEAGEPHLAKNLFSANGTVRAKAAEALADSPRKDALYFPAALAALGGTAAGPMEQAVAWLEKAKLSDEQVKAAAPVLVPLTVSERKDLRGVPVAAMKVLESHASPELLDAFLAGVKAKSPVVRGAAINGLAKVGNEKACAALAEQLNSKDHWRAASAALKKLKGPADAAVRAYLTEKKYGTNKNAAAEACRVLGEVGTPDSVAVLEGLSKHPDRAINGPAKAAAAAIRKREK